MTDFEVSRRKWLLGVGAATVVAFDPLQRGWLSRASASACPAAVPIPGLDGELRTDPATVEEGATDFGYLVSREPRAVLVPGSIEDVQRVVRFANEHDVKVAVRGQAHSVFGQAQADCGIVIDSRPLDTIHSIDVTGAWVDAGVKWSSLTLAALDQGLSPRVLTDYLELSVGGVLSVGGIGGATNRFGFVTDNVEELEVVTGRGDLVRCGRGDDLFESVLGGLGQLALIVRAKISLQPAPAFARIYDLTYSDPARFLADQRRVAADERFDFLEGQLVPAPDGGWQYLLQAGAWFDPATPPDDAALTGDLSPDASNVTDYPYFVWLNRVSFAEQALRAAGLWDTPHPWSDLFLNDRSLARYLRWATREVAPADLGAGLALLYPFKRSNLRARFVATPRSRFVWAFDLLRFPAPDPAVIEALLEQNERLYRVARRLGGRRYPVGALDFTPGDWVRHYGRDWVPFLFRKGRYDPNNVLTPGQGIFRR